LGLFIRQPICPQYRGKIFSFRIPYSPSGAVRYRERISFACTGRSKNKIGNNNENWKNRHMVVVAYCFPFSHRLCALVDDNYQPGGIRIIGEASVPPKAKSK
jgi:hypothetical protein